MENGTEDFSYTGLLGEILNDFVGYRKQFEVEAFAREAGVSKNVVYGLLAGNYTTSFEFAMRIVRVLPEEGAERFFAGLGFTGLRRIDGADGCHQEAHHELASASATYADFLRDRRIDHREDAILRTKVFPRVTAALSRLVGAR